jgi:hypothetical protein
LLRVRVRTPLCLYVSGCSKVEDDEESSVRVKKLLMKMLGFCSETVIRDWQLDEPDGERPVLTVWVRIKNRRRGRCGRCGELSSSYDQGGGERRWRHIDVGHATCQLLGDARRVD